MSAAIRSHPGAARRPPSRVSRYGLAAASVGGALLVTLSLNSPGVRGPLFIPAILASAWYGGTGPGLFAVGLSIAAINFFLTVPRYDLRTMILDDAVYLVAFGVSALLVAWLTGRQRRSEVALRAAHDDLAARMKDLQLSNEQLKAEFLERARAEAEVYKQASLLDLTHDSVIVRDLNDVITYWNRGAEERYKWRRTEALGQVSHQLMRTRFPVPLREIEAELFRTGHWEGELVHAKRDDTRVVVSSRWSLQRDEKGRPTGVLETNNDITERRRAEQLTSQVFETSPDGLSIVGRNYRYQRVNPTYERVWGVPAERFVGKHVADLLGSVVFEQELKPHLDRCFAGEDVSYSAWFSGPAGRRYLWVSYSPLRATRSDRVDAALVIGRDLTSHMEASDALQRAQAELARVTRLTTLGEITASIAHEVNQPLAAVVMNGNACRRWLAADPPDIDEAREAALRVISDGERAGQIIERIRTLVRRGVPEQSALDINEVIREALAFTRAELDRQEIATRVELSDGLAAVLGDRVQLQQVLVNLLLNACDAMAGTARTSRAVTVGSRREDAGGVLIEVRDCGRGLDRSQAERIFEAFFSTKSGGLGMGLSISRSIVERHGGKIWAAPNDGPGATMRFTLPAASGGA